MLPNGQKGDDMSKQRRDQNLGWYVYLDARTCYHCGCRCNEIASNVDWDHGELRLIRDKIRVFCATCGYNLRLITQDDDPILFSDITIAGDTRKLFLDGVELVTDNEGYENYIAHEDAMFERDMALEAEENLRLEPWWKRIFIKLFKKNLN
jgi:hypothetical protein